MMTTLSAVPYEVCTWEGGSVFFKLVSASHFQLNTHIVEEGEELRIKLPGVQEADEQGYIRAAGYWDRDRDGKERR